MATPGSALLSLRRTSTDAGAVIAVLATVLVVCTLVTGVVAAVSSWQEHALRESLQALPPQATTLEVRSSYDPAADDLAAGVRRTLQPVLDVVGGHLVTRLETVDHRQPGGRPWAFSVLTSDSDPAVPAVPAVAESGRLPSGSSGAGVVEVAAPAGSGLAEGERLTLVDPLEGDRVRVLVTGTWIPAPGTERTVLPADRDALLVHPSLVPELAGRAATVTWRGSLDLRQLTPAALDDLASAAAPVDQSLAELGDAVSASLQVENPLPATARDSAADLTAQRTLLLMPAGILLLLGAAVALIVASALATNRARDEGLLRSRGADRRRLVGPAALEAGVLCLLGGAAGVGLAVAGLEVLGVQVEVGVPMLTAAAVSAAVCWAALTAPALSRALGGDRAVAAALELRRRRVATLVVALVVLVLALGAAALLGLRRLTAERATGSGVDPLVVGAPSLLLLATTTVLALVLLPVGFRLSSSGSRSRGLALALGTRSVARSAARTLPFALVVALVAGGLVFSAVERASRTATVAAVAEDRVGADVRVLAPPASIRAGAAQEQTQLAGLPGVRDVAAVWRTPTFVDDVPADVVAADLGSTAVAALLPRAEQDLREKLADAPRDGVLPVAITDSLADSASLTTGATLELFVDGPRVLEAVGTVEDLPTVAEGRGALLLDARSLEDPPEAPDEWWLSVSDAEVDDVEQALEQRPALAGTVLSRSAVRRQLTVDPGTGGTAYDTALLATTVGAGLLGVVLIASLVLLRRRERATTSGFLRTLGASDRDITLTVALEQAVVTGGGLLVGALAGTATAVLARAAGTGGELAFPWQTTLPVLLGLLLVPLAVLALGDRIGRGSR